MVMIHVFIHFKFICELTPFFGVHYYEALLREEEQGIGTGRVQHTLKILLIRISSIPHFSASIVTGGCSPYLSISLLARLPSPSNDIEGSSISRTERWYPKRVYSQLQYTPLRRIPYYNIDHDSFIEFDISDKDVLVSGDVCVSLFSGEEKMCQLYFHTCFVDSGYLSFSKDAIDISCRDDHCYSFQAHFQIEILVQRVAVSSIERQSLNTILETDLNNHSGGEANVSGQEESLDFVFSYGDTNIEESDNEFDELTNHGNVEYFDMQ